MKPGAIIAALLAVTGLGLGVYAFMVNASPYVTAREAAATPGLNVHVAGEIDHDSAKSSDGTFSFHLVDEAGDVLPVVYYGMKPGNFESAPSASVEGAYENGKFVASRVSTQCPSKYESESPSYVSPKK
ncbi:MAG: cytochrome c maturation protein CcmE [Armatimonadota bacterium]|nr:cytochrome c maturation protein CcmE [Armatimonadota bacterium]